MLDEIDRSILDLLQVDGALPYAELGAKVGLSTSAINDRLKKLRHRGIIRRFSVDVDPAAYGLHLLAFVLVTVEGDEREFRAAMTAAPEVLECHHITGDFSYLLKLRLSDTAHLERFLSDGLKPRLGVKRTHTLIVLSSSKETHILAESRSVSAS